MAKTICWIQQKRTEAEKNGDKDGKALYKSINNAAYGQKMENLRNRTLSHLCKQQKRLFRMDIQTKPYATQKIWQWFSRDT